MRGIPRLLILTIILAACGRAEQPAPDETMVAAADSVAARGSGGMTMPSGAMMEQMRSHLRAQADVGGDSLRATLREHRQAAANLVAQLNKEMLDMNMTPDAAWQALTDSVRQDLTNLPELGATELKQGMPAHRARLERLMTMHDTMMRGT